MASTARIPFDQLPGALRLGVVGAGERAEIVQHAISDSTGTRVVALMMLMRLGNGVLANYQQCHFTPDYWRNYTVIGTEGRLENFGDTADGVVKVWNRRHDLQAAGDREYPVTGVQPGTVTVAISAVADMPIHDIVDESLVLDFADERPWCRPVSRPRCWRWAVRFSATRRRQAGRRIATPFPYRIADFDHFVYLGSGWTHGLAQEAALKVREAAQAWSESYPLLDYRHGPIAVAHAGSLVWIFGAATPELIADIESTGATVHTSDDDPLVQLVEAQRLAVALAESRGLNPDTPRHLTRSVILT